MRSVAKLDRSIRAVCPIEGVSVGSADDKKTWRIYFAPEATEEQRAAAQNVLAAFDPDAPENQPDPPFEVRAEIEAIKAILVEKAVASEAEIATKKNAVLSAK